MDRRHAGRASAQARSWTASHAHQSSYLGSSGCRHPGILQVTRKRLPIADQRSASHGSEPQFNWPSKKDNGQTRCGLISAFDNSPRKSTMKISDIPFVTTDWSKIEPTEHKGERGTSHRRTGNFGSIRVRIVEYSADFLMDHWCSKGHV